MVAGIAIRLPLLVWRSCSGTLKQWMVGTAATDVFFYAATDVDYFE